MVKQIPERKMAFLLLILILGLTYLQGIKAALTMKQFDKSLELMRNACIPKSGASVDAVDGLKKGIYPDDDKTIKCYTMCVSEMSGILNKKKEFIEAKVKTQADLLLPPELKPHATKSWEMCKGIALSLINGFKRGRMVTRAQTVIVRMFEAICNCTTQSAATLPGRVSSTRSLSTTK